jgi:replicative DNA helicase
MDIERSLVCKIISTGQLEDAISKGVRSDLFMDEECREMYEYILDHTRRYKSPPSMKAVESEKPDFEWVHVQDTLDYIVDRFNVLAKRRFANEAVIELAKLCDDPKNGPDIDLHFLEASRKLAMLVPSGRVLDFRDMDKRIEEYEHMKKEGKPPGIKFGIDKLDEWTGGIQPHEFAIIAGFSGLGKSTLLMRLALNFWLNNKTPLYISLEMEARAILRKFDAMISGLNYYKLKNLDLPDEVVETWRKKAESIKNGVAGIPVIDSIRNCTPDHVFAETIRHKPDVVIVDYLSLMRSSSPSTKGASMWQSLTEITQDLKQNARTLHTPIIAAAQTNRAGGKDGAELDNIGYSLSVVQDSDIFLGLFQDDEMREHKEMQLRVKKNRDGRLGEIMMRWDHDTMEFGNKNMFERRLEDEPEQKGDLEEKLQRPRPRPGGSL